MTHRELASLKEGTWMVDSPMTFFLKNYVQDADRRIYCYSSAFFKLLYRIGGQYRYEEVQGWSNACENGIANIKELYVPINIGNYHWIFLRVSVEDKRIELYDSMGLNPENRQYMEDMRRYMYEELTAGIPEAQRPSYNVWKREWSYQDKSRDSPKQLNGNDCCVLVHTGIHLPPIAWGGAVRVSLRPADH